MPRFRNWIFEPRSLESAFIAVLALLFAAVLCWLAWTTGITVDEGSHLVSAHRYWSGNDDLEPADMPPMIKILGGWPSHTIARMPLPKPDDPVWQTRHEWTVAGQMFQNMDPPEVRRLVAWSRTPLLIFPLSCLLLVWHWSRHVFDSSWGRCAPALAFALNPTVLAHGPLFKNDLAASFGFLLFAYRTWMLWNAPTTANAAWVGIAVLLALLSKLSMLILVPAGMLVVVGVHLHGRSPLSIDRALKILISLGAASAVVYIGVLLAWQMDFRGLPAKELESLSTRTDVPRWFYQASSLLAPLPIPERMWRGVINLMGSAGGDGNGIYFFGQIHNGGLPVYFLAAFLLKTPFSLLAVIAAGLASRRSWINLGGVPWFWLLPALLYGACASSTTLQLGIRLVLPSITCLTMFAGAAVNSWQQRFANSRRFWSLPALLFSVLAIETGSAFPHFIPYFNFATSGPERALHYLSDSNVDWGQSLPPLARYLARQPEIPKVRLYYFGLGWPGRWLTEERIELMAPPWSDDLVRDTQIALRPGYYAVSAVFLTGQLFQPQYRQYFAPLRERKPIATPGGCMFIYRIE